MILHQQTSSSAPVITTMTVVCLGGQSTPEHDLFILYSCFYQSVLLNFLLPITNLNKRDIKRRTRELQRESDKEKIQCEDGEMKRETQDPVLNETESLQIDVSVDQVCSASQRS